MSSQRASSTFCWLPPLRFRRPAAPGRAAGCRAPRSTSRPARPAAGGGSAASSRGSACSARMMFSRTVSSSTSPSVRRFSGQNATSVRRRRARAADRHRRAVDVEPPGVGAVGAEQEPRDLGAPRAEQAGEADDLARVHGEVERRDRALAADRLSPRAPAWPPPARDARGACASLERLERLELAPEHLRDELRPRQLGASATRRRAGRCAGR